MNIAMTERSMAVAQPLQNKVSLVTGSTSGIGLGIARALAAVGSSIVLNGFGKLEEIAANTHGRRVPVGAQYLEQVRALAAQARVVRVVRPQALSRLGELADRLERDFG